MKKNLFIITFLTFVLIGSGIAFAGSSIHNNKFSDITVAEGGAGGAGGAGGNATIEEGAVTNNPTMLNFGLQKTDVDNTNVGINKNTNIYAPDNNIGNGFGNFSPSAKSSSESKATAIAPTFNTNKQAQGQLQGQMQGQGQFMINHIEAPDMEPVGEGLSDIGKGIAIGGIAQGLGDAVNGIAQGAGTAYAGHVNAEATKYTADQNLEGTKYSADVNSETALAIAVNTNGANQAMAADANATAKDIAEAQNETDLAIAEIQAEAAKDAAHRSRDFAPAGQLITGGTADYRGPWDDQGPTVVDAWTILSFQDTFTYADVKDARTQTVFEGVRIRFRSVGKEYKGDPMPSMTFLKSKPSTGKFLGFAYAVASGDEADMMLVIQKAAKEGMEKGAIAAVVVGQGFTSVTDTSGWGIGISGVTSSISENGRQGTTGHYGTGFNKAKSGPEFKPYVQLALFGVAD